MTWYVECPYWGHDDLEGKLERELKSRGLLKGKPRTSPAYPVTKQGTSRTSL